MATSITPARRTQRLPALDAEPEDGHVPSRAVTDAARTAARAALDRGETHYTDRPGIVPLRRAAATALSRHRATALAENDVVITCGVTEARFVAIQKLAETSDHTVVALAHPERVEGACVIRGCQLKGPDAAVDDRVVLYVPPEADADAVERWTTRATTEGWPIVHEVNDVHEPSLATPGAGDLTVTLGDLAAPYGAEAWRVGFLAAPNVSSGPLRDFKQALTLCTTNVSQWGTLAFFEEDNAS